MSTHSSDFALIPIISKNDGTQVLLEEIASVKDTFIDSDASSTYNGKPVIVIGVLQTQGLSPNKLSSLAQDAINKIKKKLPAGIEIDVLLDRSETFNERMSLLIKNGYTGLLLVLLLLGLFLEPKLAFWITAGIPIAFLGAFLIIPYWDNTLINMQSMFAFIIALGIVVDDAIIIGENIYRHINNGENLLQAAITGTQEVAVPVTFSILTNIVAFMPIYMISGMTGRMFKVIPIVVISVIIISLIESFFILPAHLAHQKKRKAKYFLPYLASQQQKFSFWFSNSTKVIYPPVIHIVLAYRYIIISICFSIFLISFSFFQSGRFSLSLTERIETDFAQADLVLPLGYPVEKTNEIVFKLENAAQTVIEANGGNELHKSTFTDIYSSDQARIRIYLQEPDVRPISTKKFVQLWRDEVENIPDVVGLSFKADGGGRGVAAPTLSIQLTHTDSNILHEAGIALGQKLSQFEIVKDIDNGKRSGKPQINFILLPEGYSLGFDSKEVAGQIRHAFQGIKAVTQQRGQHEITVRVRLPENERNDIYTLENFIIRNINGVETPLMQIADTFYDRAYTDITREDFKRVIKVTAFVEPESEADTIKNLLHEDIMPALSDRFPGLSYTLGGRDAEMAKNLRELLWGFVLSLFIIYALLAIPFRSFFQPIIIMSCIPFEIIGAVIGHLLLGYSFSTMSLFGLVALSGIIINDSLLLIDLTNKKIKTGQNVIDSLIGAGLQRFRPIFLTSITTFGALFPIIFETSRQARFLIPMAISLAFGILFATIVTLFIIPAFYLIIEDIKWALGVKSLLT